MDGLRLFALLIYTFGAFAYGAMLLMWVRELGRVGWGARRASGRSSREADAVNGVMIVVSLLWFGCNAAQLLMGLTPQRRMWQLDVAGILLAYSFPPLIMHITWAEVAHERSTPMRPGWRVVLWPMYGAAAVLPAWFLWSIATADGRAVRTVGQTASVALSLAFIAAAAYSIALVTRSARGLSRPRQPQEGAKDRYARWSLVALFGAMALIFLFMLWVAAIAGSAGPMAMTGFMLEVVAKSLPLVFLFVSTYFENRFEFFDLFVKRGAAFLLTFGVLTVWFALALPFLRPLYDTWALPWLYAAAMLPAVGLIVWLFRHVAATLDRRWLGRRYRTVDALKLFVSALRSATSRPQAIERAEQALTGIFGAPAAVRLGNDRGPQGGFEIEHEVPIDGAGGPQGAIVMGPRASEAPYFSQDLALLASLADIFAAVLDNLDLQQRRRDQDQLAQELTLHASRSELKALRAQINPHFLFNALNAIAGLIHRNPARADRTIEQLAEVFRYALRSSDDEWTPLGDELQFVESYLAVERARFGDRLQADVRIGDGAASARIPTMVVQTLVENAVKHGLTELRGAAIVGVDAQVRNDRLVVSVTDNGPGFTPEALSATDRPAPGGGYGLANIRHRLCGYFGDRARVQIGRDAVRGLTVVSVEMPLVLDATAGQRPQEAVS
jgi:signal transduction histidine kinase